MVEAGREFRPFQAQHKGRPEALIRAEYFASNSAPLRCPPCHRESGFRIPSSPGYVMVCDTRKRHSPLHILNISITQEPYTMSWTPRSENLTLPPCKVIVWYFGRYGKGGDSVEYQR